MAVVSFFTEWVNFAFVLMFSVVEFPPQNTGRSYHRHHHHYYQYQYYYYFIFFNFYIVCYRHTACLNISAALYLTTQKESSLGQYKLEVSDKKIYTNVLVLSCHLDKLSSPLHAFPNPLLHFLGFWLWVSVVLFVMSLDLNFQVPITLSLGLLLRYSSPFLLLQIF